ncbi:MAG: hypothetical protein CM1200mP16_11960 [Nitrospina sp.]|nr:MAG: hypothetical protein CM1200mP16_11960 [Nitrospina sp.]
MRDLKISRLIVPAARKYMTEFSGTITVVFFIYVLVILGKFGLEDITSNRVFFGLFSCRPLFKSLGSRPYPLQPVQKVLGQFGYGRACL